MERTADSTITLSKSDKAVEMEQAHMIYLYNTAFGLQFIVKDADGFLPGLCHSDNLNASLENSTQYNLLI